MLEQINNTWSPLERVELCEQIDAIDALSEEIVNNSVINRKQVNNNAFDMVSTTVTNCNATITPETNQRIDAILDTLDDTSLQAVSESINALITMVQEKNLDAETQNNCFSAGLESNVLLQQYTENQSKHIVLEQNKNMQIVNARKEAFNAVVNNPTTCREQSFTLTHKACDLLKACGLDPEQFIYCVGNETKHQVYAEVATLLNELAEMKSHAPIQPLLDMTVTCTCASKMFIEQNNIVQAFNLADCAWASLDCVKEINKPGIDLQKIATDIAMGIARGLKNAVQNNVNMVLNPVETLSNVAATFCHLAYCFGKFMEPITILDGDMEVDAEVIAKVNAEWLENMQSVIDAAQEITLEGATAFITEFIAGPKITKLGFGVLSRYAQKPVAELVKFVKEAKETIGDKAQKATSAIRKTLAEQLGHVVKEESIAVTTDGVKVAVPNASKEAGELHHAMGKNTAQSGDKISKGIDVKNIKQNIPEFIRDNRVPLDHETILNSNMFEKTSMQVKGARVYKKDGLFYHRDTLHRGKGAHLEVYNKQGKHLGIADPITGELISGTDIKGRKI